MRIDLPSPQDFQRMMEEETRERLTVMPTGISLDSREAQTGDLFVAVKGETVDGHDFVSHARENGCVAALIAEPRNDVDLPQIQVKSPTVAIANVAKQWRSNFSVPTIGITGTNGKTTTKDLLVHIFSATHRVHGTRGNYNTRLGLPLTLLELTSHHTLSILEMGANQRGDIDYLCDLSLPRYGLITNIAPSHLTYFGSIENITKSKGELFEALPPHGTAFVNMEDERVGSLTTPAKKITYGFGPDCDFTADLHRDSDGRLSLTLNSHEISLNSYNKTFAQNALAACAVSITQGISWESCQESILSFTPTKGRCHIIQSKGITIIDDTYNANPISTLSALEHLLSLPARGRRIVVFGDMLELGDESQSYHQKVGEQFASSGVDLLLCYGDESRATVDCASSHIDARHYVDKSKLSRALIEEAEEGDAVLLKGSRGMALETVMSDVFGT